MAVEAMKVIRNNEMLGPRMRLLGDYVRAISNAAVSALKRSLRGWFILVMYVMRGWFVLAMCVLVPGAFFPIVAKLFLMKTHTVAFYVQVEFLIAVFYSYACIVAFPLKVSRKREGLVLALCHLGYLFIMFGGSWIIVPGAILWPRSTIMYMVPAGRLIPWDLFATAFLFDGAFLLAVGLTLFFRSNISCSANAFRRVHRHGKISIIALSFCFTIITCVLFIKKNYSMAMGTAGAYAVVVSLYYISFYLSRRCAKAFLKRRGINEQKKEKSPGALCGSV